MATVKEVLHDIVEQVYRGADERAAMHEKVDTITTARAAASAKAKGAAGGSRSKRAK